MEWKRLIAKVKPPELEDVIFGAVAITCALAVLDALWRWLSTP